MSIALTQHSSTFKENEIKVKVTGVRPSSTLKNIKYNLVVVHKNGNYDLVKTEYEFLKFNEDLKKILEEKKKITFSSQSQLSRKYFEDGTPVNIRINSFNEQLQQILHKDSKYLTVHAADDILVNFFEGVDSNHLSEDWIALGGDKQLMSSITIEQIKKFTTYCQLVDFKGYDDLSFFDYETFVEIYKESRNYYICWIKNESNCSYFNLSINLDKTVEKIKEMKSEDLFEPFIEEDEFSVVKKEKKEENKIQKNEFSDFDISELKKIRTEKIEERIKLSNELNEEEGFILTQNKLIDTIENELNLKENEVVKIFEVSLDDLSLRFNQSIPPFIEDIFKHLLNIKEPINLDFENSIDDSLNKLMNLIESESNLNLNNFKSIELIYLIKLFLQKLPIKLVSNELTNQLKKLKKKQVKDFKTIFQLLSNSNEIFLIYLFKNFSELIFQESIKKNELALIFSSVIFDSKQISNNSNPTFDIFYFLLENINKFELKNDFILRNISNRPHLYYYSCISSLCLIPLLTDEFLNEQKRYSNIENEIILNEDDSIKCASINKLIILLTTKNDEEFDWIFLLTHKCFISSEELLKYLKLRYNTPPPLLLFTYNSNTNLFDISLDKFQSFFESTLLPIRKRIYLILKKWVENFYYDFKESKELKNELFLFLEEMEMTKMEYCSNEIKLLIIEKSKNKETLFEQKIEEKIDNSLKIKLGEGDLEKDGKSKTIKKKLKEFLILSPRNTLDRNVFDSLIKSYSSFDLTFQLTKIEIDSFKLIQPNEFLNKNWIKENRKEKSQNINQIIERSNLISKWVINEIINSNDLKERVSIISKFIRILSISLEIQNYNLLIELLFGLNSHPILRLKKTWNSLPKSDLLIFSKLNKLFEPKGNYKNLKEEIEKRIKCNDEEIGIPFLGMYLTNLMFIEERYSDLKFEMINWTKRKLQSKIIFDFQSFQKNFSEIQDYPELKERIIQIDVPEMEELYAVSLQIEH
eukprot:gene8510-334_t